ncbi:GNAT family N-acetyltransferase [Archaeoglobus neptunius]|uniref:GNAT family N-acetyltransferase n=1 Tax=Archaeoglobus neptunius TaxID=2798580 RepID=UPI001928BD18|nr:N-acetyltransferase [Archaeoglobus neptunius]
MRVRNLEARDSKDAARILILSFERELNGIFGDIELARELFFKFFGQYTENCFVVEEGRIIGFASYSSGNTPISDFLKRELGFVRGLKTSLLIRYLCPKPKRGEGVINFIAVSPLRRNCKAGSALLERIVEDASEKRLRLLKVYVSVDNDAGIGLFTKYGFEIEKMIDHRFAEKNFGFRQWYLMKKELDPQSAQHSA